MKYIYHDNIKIYYDFKFLLKGFLAITLFGNVYCKLSKENLLNFLKTSYGKSFVNHEKIHIKQAHSLKGKWLSFYSIYLWEWIKGLFKYNFNNNKAYYNVHFEREAYMNEKNLHYLDNGYIKNSWKNYKQ